MCPVKWVHHKYNSGLFHFEVEKGQSSHPDTLTPTLKIDDKVFKDILANLYLPKSPYAFNYFSAEILGQVYERFLGKVIRLTAGGHAKVEEKPEVRKAGGVYYTPAYIVEYIVKNTVGELLKDKTPADLQADPIRIVDPACGSGSFLLGAYQFLLDWTLNWYIANDPAKWAKGKNPPIYEGDKAWQLTMEKKKELLTSHIFGVDIDAQAVEVTKLSLLLKVVENPGQLDLFGERILPDLGENIKCGNSLIGPDYYDNQQLTMFDTEEQYRVNAFDWHKAFPKAFAKGGFDAVIGNPPYIQLSMEAYYSETINKYLLSKYSGSMGRQNTFGYFIEFGLKQIVRQGGFISFIVPNTLLTQSYYKQLREVILDYSIINLTSFSMPVFADAVVETIVFVFSKSRPNKSIEVINFNNKTMIQKKHLLDQSVYLTTNDKSFLVAVTQDELKLKTIFDENELKLKDYVNINQAIALKMDRSKSLFSEKKAENYKKVIDGRNINRYQLAWNGQYLAYDINKIHSCKRTDIFEIDKKIFFRRVGSGLIATIDTEKMYALNTLVVITLKPLTKIKMEYILGLLNSKALNHYYVNYLKSTKKVFSEIQANQIAELPVRQINFSDPADVARHDRMVALVESMLNLHKQSTAARLPDEKDRLARQIQQTDRQIDKLVYELYDLTPDEIKIVEGG